MVAPFLFAPADRLQVRMMSGVVSERADTGAGWNQKNDKATDPPLARGKLQSEWTPVS